MQIIFFIVIVGVITFRKQFSYIELLPNLYIIEVFMLLISASFIVNSLLVGSINIPRIWRKNFFFPCSLVFFAFCCLILTFSKLAILFIEGGDANHLRELPILIYPSFLIFTTFWLFQQNKYTMVNIGNVLTYSIILFPIFYLFIYFGGLLDFFNILERPLWPNNNFIFATCILATLFHEKRYSVWLLWVSCAAALFGILVEAQRGAFVCLFFASILLVREVKQLAYLSILGFAIILLVAIFGVDLSYRFQNGVSDLLDFFMSIQGSSDDLRYSSTAHREQMWLDVFGDVMKSPEALIFGKPISESIVLELWRNPHNGYVSALGRGGVAALAFYLILLFDSIKALLFSGIHKRNTVLHFLYFACCIDAFTQTVFDSPYSLFLLILSAAFSIVDRSRYEVNSRIVNR